MRVLNATSGILNTYGETGELSGQDVVTSVFNSEIGTVESVQNICTGQGTMQDFVGMALMLTPGGGGGKKKNSKTNTSTGIIDTNNKKVAADGDTPKVRRGKNNKSNSGGGDGKAYGSSKKLEVNKDTIQQSRDAYNRSQGAANELSGSCRKTVSSDHITTVSGFSFSRSARSSRISLILLMWI